MDSMKWVEKTPDEIYDELMCGEDEELPEVEDEYENSSHMDEMISRYGRY